jgi:hypothetical protein
VGTVLLQEGKRTSPSLKHTRQVLNPIAYYLATFTPVERNYDIYKWELLAIMKSLAHWQPYLGWMKEQFMILTDHANLQYWKPQRISTDEQLDGIWTSKNTTMKSNTFPAAPIYQQMPYHNHLE